MATPKQVLQIVLISLLVILLAPILVVFLILPLLLWRWFLTRVYRCRNPSSLGILSPHSSLWYLLLPGTGKSRWTLSNAHQLIVVLNVKLEGPTLDISAFRELVSREVVYACAKKGRARGEGGLLHPELQQFPELWAGYLFWKRDSEFKIENHIQLYKSEGDWEARNAEFCYNFVQTYRKEELPPNRSPWQAIAIENVEQTEGEEPCTLIVFKFAHYFADGYSIFNAIARLADGGADRVRRYEPASPSRLAQLLQLLMYPIRGPFDFLASRFEAQEHVSALGSHDSWRPPEGDIEKGPRPDRSLALSAPCPALNTMRSTAKQHKVSLTTVMLVSFTRGLRKHLEQQGRILPTSAYLRCSIPFPAQNHAAGITNDMRLTILRIPMHSTSLDTQLREFESEIARVKKSTIPATMALIWSALGIMPATWTWKLAIYGKVYGVDGALSIFPGPREQFSIMGRRVLGMNFCNAMADPLDALPLILCLLTYNGRIQFWLSASHSLVPQNQIPDLVAYIEEEVGKPCN